LEKLTDTILIRGARQLVTLRGGAGPRRGPQLGDLQIIPDGSLLIADGVLKEVGPTRRIENLASARGAVEINAAGRVVMPGFIDGHTHLAFPPNGAKDDFERALRVVRVVTGKRLRSQNRAHLAAMARHGTTTVEVKTGCGPEEDAEIKLLRILASLDSDPIDLLPTFLLRLPPEDSRAAMGHVIEDLLPKIHRRRLARFADLVLEDGGPPANFFSEYLETARDLGFARKVHATGAARCSEAIALAVGHQAMSVDGLTRVTGEDARLLAASRTIGTLMISAPLSDGPQTGRILTDAGAAISLATAFNPNRPGTLSMQTVVGMAHLCQGLSIAEAIAASTINAAHALGCGDQTGSLEPGKFADLIMLDISDYRELDRHFGTNRVHLVMKRGCTIYREAEVTAPEPWTGSRPRV